MNRPGAKDAKRIIKSCCLTDAENLSSSAQGQINKSIISTNPDFFVVGFRLSELESEYEECIKRLIADFSIEETVSPPGAESPACSLSSTTGR